jgi:GT2 family glycosyltransferase
MFAYPIGVQLFNRPDYSEKVLLSLKSQTLSVNEKTLFIFIDGFKGSIYESRGSADKTLEVAELARGLFPEATIHHFDANCGIADLHNKLQEAAFSGDDTWAAFFEEDLILEPTYLQELSDLIDIVDETEDVVKVACFQILPSMAHLPRGYDGFYPGRGTQAFAERRDFFYEKQPQVLEFIKLMASELKEEGQFKNSKKAAELASRGHFLPYLQHDALVEDIMRAHSKIHVVTRPNLVQDIGVDGVHNYVTPQVSILETSIIEPSEIQARRDNLQQQIPKILEELQDYYLAQMKDVFDSFHLTRSRKAMLKHVLLHTFFKH